ncbi:MATE family efflux transporter [Reinekea sp. G2M2-21]|uniref:MATE family efflux transporter n=1 Tax=Reinekea sp. G2M2-21 TaxID=2788942 RepID=UPI0018AABD75|nr:MATE family efflux transporter [Reinekea sp. G2M2-21]
MSIAQSKVSLREIFRVAIPVSLQALVTSSLSFVDIYMVASLGEASVAAVGLVSKIYFIMILMLVGFTGAVSLLVAQYWGAQRKRDVNALLTVGLIWSLAITIPLLLIGLLFSPVLAAWLSPNADITNLTGQYWQWTAPFALLTGTSMVLATTQRATDDAFWPMVASITALLSNTLMNYLVLFGPFEALHVGMPGVAMATNLSRLLEVGLLAFVLIRHLKPVFHWQRTMFWRVWRHGRLLVAHETLWSSGIFTFFVIYSHMGENELAAMSLLSPIDSIMIDLFIGFGIAASILVGQRLGRSQFEEAWSLSQYMLIRFPAAAFLVGVVLACVAPLIVPMFTTVSEEVRRHLLYAWWVYSLALALRIHNVIAVLGVLRAGGDNNFVMRTEIVSIWFLTVPLAAVAGLIIGLPLWMVVTVTMLEEAGKVGWFQWRIRKRLWLKNLTLQEDH